MTFYVSKLPKSHDGESFYLRPRAVKPKNPDDPWFICMPIGRNTLDTLVAKMFATVGIEGKTNHSLRVTGASRLFTSKVPEKIVQQRTGHRSLEALRKYERTSKDQEVAVSSILSSPSPVLFADDEPRKNVIPVQPIAPLVAPEPVPQVVEKTSVPISSATPVAKETIPVAAPTVSMDEIPPKP